MSNHRWLVLGLLLVLSAGCARRVGDSSEDSGPAPAALYPLAVGNKWTYEATFLGQKRQSEVEILSNEEGFFVDSQGGKMRVDAYGLRDDKRYLLREPLLQGRTWTNVVSVSSIEHYQVLDVGFRCDAPAGEFQDCVRVEGRNRVDARTTLINQMTFAPGVGLVRLEMAAEINGKRVPQSQLLLTAHQLRTPPSSQKP